MERVDTGYSDDVGNKVDERARAEAAVEIWIGRVWVVASWAAE